MFNRIISIDWSGAGSETEGVDLRVATFDASGNKCQIVDRPYTERIVVSWTRAICRAWLEERLRETTPTLIAMDFGFGLPWGSDQAVFRVGGWRRMLGQIGEHYRRHVTARATAQAINKEARYNGYGPYRFDDGRNNFRFYVDHKVPYFRLTELTAPQAISQWYLGSGGTVGFHTISGLAALDHLISLRDSGRIDFVVWPHEAWIPPTGKHVIVESYPALCPRLDDYGPCRGNDGNQRDAWRMLQYLVAARANNRLNDLFKIEETPFGRIIGVTFEQQIQFEGFIFGLR
ncbi:MAG TPA: hypothetical protein PKC18_00670 [Lacipirellulaceae bacterium]|nr:hypothetical protein [Lacipirellulaceae bacterium]HMP07270.1 hypothetical protein [Lacipirellulaceae bacterium]